MPRPQTIQIDLPTGDPRKIRGAEITTQLKQEKSKKLGIQGKRRRAGWDSAYLETVLRMREL